MNKVKDKFYETFVPSMFQRYPNGQNCRVVYMFKNKLMNVESPRSSMVYTLLYISFISDYDQIILVDLLPKEFRFVFLGYVSEDNVMFNASVVCSAKIKQKSDYYEMVINDTKGTVAKLKSALGRRIGFYIKDRGFSEISSFSEEEFKDLKQVIFQLNSDNVPFELTDIEEIHIELTHENVSRNLEDYRIRLETAKSDLNEMRARKPIKEENLDFDIKLQEKENQISELRFEMEKMRISGLNELEIEKQKELEKIISKKKQEEYAIEIERIDRQYKWLDEDPDRLKVVNPELYQKLEEFKFEKPKNDAFIEGIKHALNIINQTNHKN